MFVLTTQGELVNSVDISSEFDGAAEDEMTSVNLIFGEDGTNHLLVALTLAAALTALNKLADLLGYELAYIVEDK